MTLVYLFAGLIILSVVIIEVLKQNNEHDLLITLGIVLLFIIIFIFLFGR